MRGFVAESMEGGALGLSTNRNERHMREDGKPVASRLADDEELFALCDVLTERNSGVIQTNWAATGRADSGMVPRMAGVRSRPILWQSVQYKESEPNLWRE
jgi:N-acyl-D-aspartate/D-glutamate deacylase